MTWRVIEKPHCLGNSWRIVTPLMSEVLEDSNFDYCISGAPTLRKANFVYTLHVPASPSRQPHAAAPFVPSPSSPASLAVAPKILLMIGGILWSGRVAGTLCISCMICSSSAYSIRSDPKKTSLLRSD